MGIFEFRMKSDKFGLDEKEQHIGDKAKELNALTRPSRSTEIG